MNVSSARDRVIYPLTSAVHPPVQRKPCARYAVCRTAMFSVMILTAAHGKVMLTSIGKNVLTVTQ